MWTIEQSHWDNILRWNWVALVTTTMDAPIHRSRPCVTRSYIRVECVYKWVYKPENASIVIPAYELTMRRINKRNAGAMLTVQVGYRWQKFEKWNHCVALVSSSSVRSRPPSVSVLAIVLSLPPCSFVANKVYIYFLISRSFTSNFSVLFAGISSIFLFP